MAKVNDLLMLQYLVIQISASDHPEPTVGEVAGWGDSNEMLEHAIEAGRNAGVDVSYLETWSGTERGTTLNEVMARATNAIDPERKYGFSYDSALGWHALLWWINDQVPSEARDVTL